MSGVVEFVAESLAGVPIGAPSRLMLLCEACWSWWEDGGLCEGQVCHACCKQIGHQHQARMT